MDYIPGIDSNINSISNSINPKDSYLVDHIKNLIDSELKKIDTSKLHPSIKINQNTNSIIPISENGIKPFMEKDLSEKYTKTSTIDDLKLLASYSQLRLIKDKTIDSITNNNFLLENLLLLESQEKVNELNELKEILNKKRKSLDELSDNRRKQIKSFKPVNDFLYNRWNEKINELIQLELELESKSSSNI